MDSTAPFADSTYRNSKATHVGILIVNADDWGRDRETTDRTLDCILRGGISSVSAMVYMADSERAAQVALENGIDAGLHLNLTTPFSAAECPAPLVERQSEIAVYLRKHPFARVLFHPGLAQPFEYVVRAQITSTGACMGKSRGDSMATTTCTSAPTSS